MSRRLLGLIPLAALAWAVSGTLVVGPDEVAVIYRFGAVSRTAGAGLGYRLPGPLEWDERVVVTASRRTEPTVLRLLTGDTNVVDLEVAAKYVVVDPVAFSTSLQEPAGAVTDQTLAAATELVATMEVEELLTTGRAALERGIRGLAQRRLDALSAGLGLTSVEVLALTPPSPVLDAFNDVSSARGDKETLALSADAYASEVVPDARGHAARRVEEAHAAASERIAQAQADISRFQALASAHAEAAEATRLELRQRSLETIGGRVEIVVARPETVLVLPLPGDQEVP